MQIICACWTPPHRHIVEVSSFECLSHQNEMVGGSVAYWLRLTGWLRQACSRTTLTAIAAVLSAAWSFYVYQLPARCPPGSVCIDGERFGAGPPVTPYAEYSEASDTLAVYRVSALLKTERSAATHSKLKVRALAPVAATVRAQGLARQRQTMMGKVHEHEQVGLATVADRL